MSVTPTWATALLSLIGFILLVLMILAWVAMFGDDCGCCGQHYGRCCPPRICGYRDEDEEMITCYEDENILAAAETLMDSPEHVHCPHHKHHCHVEVSDEDEAHS